MHNNIKNNEHDAFSESIRQKLEGHQTPVEPALWDAVAAGITATKAKRRFPFVWWITTGLAAAVALLLFVNIPINQNELTIASTTKSSVVEKSKPAESLAQNKEIIVSTSDNNVLKTKSSLSKEKKTDNSIQINVSESPILKKEMLEKEVFAVNDTKAVIEIPTETSAVLTQIENKLTKETPIDTMVSKPNSTPSEKLQLKKEDWTDPLKEKNNSKWELVAMVGSAGKSNTNTNLESAPVFDFSPRMGIVSAERATTYIFAPEDFSDKTYLAPVSAGFALARKISPVLSVETGVTYTYLLTMFKNNTVESKLNLHYIGLPVRVVYDFLNNNKWSFYAAAGGMIEKGLWSVYVQNQNYPNSIITTTVTDKISGWQFSVNTSVGGTYNIYKNAAIYFEPKLSYYFDTDQPISIRTVTNVVVGFEGGLRYKF
jgi:hypothetical protein